MGKEQTEKINNMDFLQIDWNLLRYIKELFPSKNVKEHIYYIPVRNRWIQISTPIEDVNIHYEYILGHIELHFEGDEIEEKYQDLIDYLQQKSEYKDNYKWEDSYCCQEVNLIKNHEELKKAIEDFVSFFDDCINEYSTEQEIKAEITIIEKDLFEDRGDRVELEILKLQEVLQLPLSIPSYQRIYCWEENNVITLLEDLFLHFENKSTDCVYRLGTIILHRHDKKYDILDGQQRLVTLTLLLTELGVFSPLLEQVFLSETSLKYIAYNKFLIHSFCKKNRRKSQKIVEFILKNIDFNVLILQNSSIDLAYKFFSNQNSLGVQLTDYDLLKAHHLRYIPQGFDKQAERYAENWNKMIEDARESLNDSNEYQQHDKLADYVNTLDIYLYRLRKWSRKHSCEDDSVKYRIKQEYEAAPIIEEIAPFKETFYFIEPIQGGSHFFSFVEQHRAKYHQFIQDNTFLILHSVLNGGTNQWYRDVIEALLFGYYLKFGDEFLTDSLFAIMRVILQHRYVKAKTSKASIDQWAKESEIIMMINQATSPTFFLAEVERFARNLNYPFMQEMTPIQKNMKRKACEIVHQLENQLNIENFKNLNK